MPTINQLVRQGRQTSVKKSTAPALGKGFNSLHRKATNINSPQKAFARVYTRLRRRNRTRH